VGDDAGKAAVQGLLLRDTDVDVAALGAALNFALFDENAVARRAARGEGEC
jgi:hypothetical protein